MINRESLLAFEFYKKKPFKGSDQGIRYMVVKEERTVPATDAEAEETKTTQVLTAYLWPEPFCFEATDDAKKIHCDFPFSEEGLCSAVDWMNGNRHRILDNYEVEE